MSVSSRIALIALIVSIAALYVNAAVTFRCHFDAATQTAPATGRLIVFVQKAKSPTTAAATTQNVSEGDHLYGIDVASLRPGDHATVDDAAASFPQKLSTLSGGRYESQALLRINHEDSNWRCEPGNLYSQTVSFNVDASSSTVDITLSKMSALSTQRSVPGAEVFSIRSKLLSDFHHRDRFLRAAVIFPLKPDPAGNAVVYRVPGFGGNGISMASNPLPKPAPNTPAAELADKTFTIWLDPESGNGHTLFANSDNNGPMGDALVTELIPALEQKYHLIANPNARILQGHSSGGWAVLWLATQYPQTFGACFCASPDPVDFRKLEMIDIYNDENAYKQGNIDTLGSRSGSRVRDENAIEEVLGPHNTSGHDWDAWQAVWGHRDPAGHPATALRSVHRQDRSRRGRVLSPLRHQRSFTA